VAGLGRAVGHLAVAVADLDGRRVAHQVVGEDLVAIAEEADALGVDR
jgi:hypothetical protein